MEALKELEREHYDLLILDYFMQPIHGDEVVERIRKTDYELYILLLTGHKDVAPPVNTLKSLAIQAYCEKSDRTDQLQLLCRVCYQVYRQMRTIKQFQEGLNSILGSVPRIYQLQPIGSILEEILRQILPLVRSEDAFILIDELPEAFGIGDSFTSVSKRRSIFCGIGSFCGSVDTFTVLTMNSWKPSGARVPIVRSSIRPRVSCFPSVMSAGVPLGSYMSRTYLEITVSSCLRYMPVRQLRLSVTRSCTRWLTPRTKNSTRHMPNLRRAIWIPSRSPPGCRCER